MSQTVKEFFQLIVPRTLHELEIPTRFVRKHGDVCLSSRTALLVAPNDDTWLVCVEKRDDGVVMFGAGWTEFARHYSSSGGEYFVEFRYKHHYKSSPVFNVIILEYSTRTEITYPMRVKGPFFEICLPTIGYPRLPIEFHEEAGLCKETTLVLQGQIGNKFNVKLNQTVSIVKSKEYIGYFVGAGWSDFLKENGFSANDKLFFQQIEGCLISFRKIG